MERLRIALTMVRSPRFEYHELEDAVMFSYRRKSYKIHIVLTTNLDGNGYTYIINKYKGKSVVLIPLLLN